MTRIAERSKNPLLALLLLVCPLRAGLGRMRPSLYAIGEIVPARTPHHPALFRSL